MKNTQKVGRKANQNQEFVFTVMYLLGKLKPFEQKEHFS